MTTHSRGSVGSYSSNRARGLDDFIQKLLNLTELRTIMEEEKTELKAKIHDLTQENGKLEGDNEELKGQLEVAKNKLEYSKVIHKKVTDIADSIRNMGLVDEEHRMSLKQCSILSW
jgi:cell shape-determining protein MreC